MTDDEKFDIGVKAVAAAITTMRAAGFDTEDIAHALCSAAGHTFAMSRCAAHLAEDIANMKSGLDDIQEQASGGSCASCLH